jgi:hypothetical protein
MAERTDGRGWHSALAQGYTGKARSVQVGADKGEEMIP